ncbi:MAG: DUF262 domain-containing protein [Anaerolineae bacterium]|nr:DUF262 domain-containing protein [Anaerolineae bacterium]
MDKVFSDFYTVPNYQREFVWQPENVEKLLEDVFNEFYRDEDEEPSSSQEYFIGSIVVCPYHDGTFELIDGQQRLTTIFLLLCAIRDALQQESSSPPDTLRRYITDTSMDPRTGDDVNRYRIVLQYEDSRNVLEQIGGNARIDTIPQDTGSTRNIIAAYETAKGFLAERFDKDPKQIKSFLAKFTSRVKLIRIETPNRAYALKIFGNHQ